MEVLMMVRVEMELVGVVWVLRRREDLPGVPVPVSVVRVSVMVVVSGRRVGSCWDEEELRVGVEGS